MLELSGAPVALVDEPLDVRLRGLGEDAGEDVLWRARLRDDDGRVWRASAERPEHLMAGLKPAKGGTGRVPALGSRHPIRLDVLAEAADGRGAKRTFERRLLADGVRVRRWREPGLRGTLAIPAPGTPVAEQALLLDARVPRDPEAGELLVLAAFVAPLAIAVLASRGVVALALTDADDLAPALERLGAVPGVLGDPRVVRALGAGDVPLLPPGIPLLDEGRSAREARIARWWSLAPRTPPA
jgi:hypothetical protein